jgi:antitoxin PrlF
MMTSKGQVTIPKKIRDALKLGPGSAVEFAVNDSGEVVVRRGGVAMAAKRDRFDAARGKAEIRWTTAELMALLRD